MAPSKSPRCPDCATLRAADAILRAAHAQGTFPRSLLEQQVLQALQSLAPLPLTTLQVACLIDEGTYREVSTTLKALVMLGQVQRWRRGYYLAREGR